MAQPLSWGDAKARFSMPGFAAVRDPLEELNSAMWPSRAVLNQIADQRSLKNFRGIPLKFIAPDGDETIPLHYETRIAETGEILTRENWHDFFNVLQWLSFPQAKAAISEMHSRLLAMHVGEVKTRSIPRDVLTLFDEGGVIVASSDNTLLDLIRHFQWRTLFVERREEVMRNMHFYLVGHSLLEKMLDPFIGITAKALLVLVDGKFHTLAKPAQIVALDTMAREWLMNTGNLTSTRNLQPLPILGIPNWDARNASPAFYDDTHYFRSGRTKKL